MEKSNRHHIETIWILYKLFNNIILSLLLLYNLYNYQLHVEIINLASLECHIG